MEDFSSAIEMEQPSLISQSIVESIPSNEYGEGTEEEEADKLRVEVRYKKSTPDLVESNISEKLIEVKNDTDATLNLEIFKKEMVLGPGTVYKFRITVVDPRGRGPSSENSKFKPCEAGIPGAPIAPYDIIISKTVNGAVLRWKPGQPSNGDVKYFVFMAVTGVIEQGEGSSSETPPTPTRVCVEVYSGPLNECTVTQEQLNGAYIDNTTAKPIISFRIIATNKVGSAPQVQVDWVQYTKS